MKNRCSINYISIITVPNIILSYHETQFEIITSILPDRQFDRPPEIYHNSDGCRKGAQFLCSCKDYRGEPHEIYCKVLEKNKKGACKGESPIDMYYFGGNSFLKKKV